MKKMMTIAACGLVSAAVHAQEVASTNESTDASAQVEVVNDGGVEVVRVYEETAPSESPTKVAPKDAYDEVRQWIKSKGWKIGRWDGRKKRIIIVEREEFDCDDPAKLENVMIQRDMAVKRAVLQAKVEIIEFIKSEVSAEDIVEFMGGNSPNATEADKKAAQEKAEAVKRMTQTSAAAFLAEMPLFGATCVRQAESWNKGKYQLAVALVWSPALERSARAVLTQEKIVCKPKEGGKDVEAWLEDVNPAFMCGPVQFVDADGTRWFVGISAMPADEDLNAQSRREFRRIAELNAKQMAVFSLYGDVKAYEETKTRLASETAGAKAKSKVETAAELAQVLSQKVKDLPVRGLGKLYGEEVEHPVSGGMIYVAIYGINQDGAEAALEIETVNWKTREEVERVKTRERGRGAANQALVERAKNDPADFKKGYDEQSANLRKESAARAMGGKSVQQKASAQKRAKVSQAGVFNGGVDVDDDDL